MEKQYMYKSSHRLTPREIILVANAMGIDLRTSSVSPNTTPTRDEPDEHTPGKRFQEIIDSLYRGIDDEPEVDDDSEDE